LPRRARPSTSLRRGDLDRGRRPGTLRDFHELLMLSQSFDVIHLLGPLIEPQDVPPPFRHLEVTLAQLTLSDKIPFVYSRGRPQVLPFALIDWRFNK
jgi:trimethylamine---corrinoid protein Co-methyltransferase